MNIPVVYEDQALLIVDKPSGLLVIPTPKNESRTLTSILNDYAAERRDPYQLHPCHRLDRETSGLMIYAKGKSMQQRMMDLFKRRQVKKSYTAFVQGRLEKKQGVINRPIEGLPSTTEYKVIKELRDFSIVEVMALTGRTNQIRIHFKAIGHPLVGETKFAFRKDYALRAKRVCLHSGCLQFVHPVTHKNIKVFSSLPEDLKKFLSLHAD